MRTPPATAIGASPDSTKLYVTGLVSGSPGGVDYATLAYDAVTGAQLWAKQYNGPANSGLDFFSVVIPSEGFSRSGQVASGDIVKF